MTEAEARLRIETMTAWSTDPVLTSGEVDLLVADARRADAYGLAVDTRAEWATTTVYAVDVEVIPTTPNGHYYRVTVAGTSGATEPTWPTTSGGTVVSGTATFAEYGASWLGAWDINSAAAEGWRWKASKAANRYALSTDGQSLSRNQILEHCLAMAERYSAKVFQNVRVPGGLATTYPASVETN